MGEDVKGCAFYVEIVAQVDCCFAFESSQTLSFKPRTTSAFTEFVVKLLSVGKQSVCQQIFESMSESDHDVDSNKIIRSWRCGLPHHASAKGSPHTSST